ncbi:hypothetical protein DXG01_000410, partial [Tephrocybe rancida]
QTADPSTPRPKFVRRQGFEFNTHTREWTDDAILAQMLDPFGSPEHPTGSSRKHALKAFYAAVLLQGHVVISGKGEREGTVAESRYI